MSRKRKSTTKVTASPTSVIHFRPTHFAIIRYGVRGEAGEAGKAGGGGDGKPWLDIACHPNHPENCLSTTTNLEKVDCYRCRNTLLFRNEAARVVELKAQTQGNEDE